MRAPDRGIRGKVIIAGTTSNIVWNGKRLGGKGTSILTQSRNTRALDERERDTESRGERENVMIQYRSLSRRIC